MEICIKMRNLEDCKLYEPPIKRLTKSNSMVFDGRVVYIVKKTYEGKAIKMFIAYDEATKTQLAGHWDKDKLIAFLAKQDMSVFGADSRSLF